MASSKSSSIHKRKLAAALRKMGTSLATHTESTFKPSGVASKALDEFKARRAAEKLGLLPAAKPKVVERYEIDADTTTVTKLPLRMKTR
jgi:lambda repressor-like predicted transcriptional regulator